MFVVHLFIACLIGISAGFSSFMVCEEIIDERVSVKYGMLIGMLVTIAVSAAFLAHP